MAKKRYSIYPSAALDRALDARMDPRGEEGLRSRSSMISMMADRYHALVERHMPRLELAQWLLIFDALNGCWMLDNASGAANGLPLEIADADRLSGAGEKWGVDGQALASQLAQLGFAERIAIVDTAERFWAQDVQPDGDLSDAAALDQWRQPVRRLVGALADD